MNVIADMIGTLTTGSPVLGRVKWVRHNLSTLRANVYLARASPAYLLAKLGLIDWQRWGQSLMYTALPSIKNPSRESLDRMGEWSGRHELWPKRRQDVLDRLVDYAEEGAQVYVPSSVYEPTVIAFANRIGARGIGTPLEVADGRVQRCSKPERPRRLIKPTGVGVWALPRNDSYGQT